MACTNPIYHEIKKGDNLYRLSRHYKTTVPEIMALNPYIDPYYLKTGSEIALCPGEGYVYTNDDMGPFVFDNDDGYPYADPMMSRMPQMPPVAPMTPANMEISELDNAMRLAWLRHVYWTRMFMESAVFMLPDVDENKERLLQNPKEIADIFGKYYGGSERMAIENLIEEHLKIGGDLIIAARDGKVEESEKLNNDWYKNADEIAEALSKINPYFDRNRIANMLYSHLDMTKGELAAILSGDYRADIKAFNMIENEAIEMAEYFSKGIADQFSNK